MTGVRIRLPITDALKKIQGTRADAFRGEMLDYLEKVLNTAYANTPVRDYNTIAQAQRRQYKRRVNYIPTSHGDADIVLIVNDKGEEWLKVNGQWYRPDVWQLPDDVWAQYQKLLAERERRLETSQTDFVKNRAQARFLYRRSWVQIGTSAGVNVRASRDVLASYSRRKPYKEPKRGYVRFQGGKKVFTCIIYNPFLDEASRYKTFNSKEIVNAAMKRHATSYRAALSKKELQIIEDLIRLFLV